MGLNETPSAGETQVDEGAIAGRAVARFVRDWRLGVAEAQVRFQEKNLHFLLKDLHLCIKTAHILPITRPERLKDRCL